MALFRFDLVSPQAMLFSDEVEQVDLPGREGDFGVLAGHAPIVALLRPGIVTARKGGTATDDFALIGGVAEFSGAALTVLADAASPADEFDLAGLKARIELRRSPVRCVVEPTPACPIFSRAWFALA